MHSRKSTVDFTHLCKGTMPTPDALMVALLEQQKLLENKDKALEENSTRIKNQQAHIAVLEEKLRLKNQRLFGASSEKNLSQQNWLADEAELLADGQPDPDDGEEAAEDDDTKPPPRKPR